MAEVDCKSEQIYTLVHASKQPEEHTRSENRLVRARTSLSADTNILNRLDLQHEALMECLDGKLCLGLEPDESPRRILEIGAGSGVWATLAATTFPEAEIVAVDLAEVPSILPANVKFIKADLSKPFNFAELASFDLVHSRLTIVHIPNYREVLHRAADMVKPGGLISVEDPDYALHSDAGLSLGFKEWLVKLEKARTAEGLCFDGCKEYKNILADTGAFSSINARMLPVPLWGATDGTALERLGDLFRIALNIMWRYQSTRFPDLTPDMGELAIAELNDEGQHIYLDYYYTYARKRL
ncbi:S-adenosyl-L-methionine-dependent methyltransferase [Ramaria rubella]|nr:S-adenosyl-L-methionine-dependent methyltransferase [Ramaria rubella]